MRKRKAMALDLTARSSASLSDEPQKRPRRRSAKSFNTSMSWSGTKDPSSVSIAFEVHSTDKLDPTTFWAMAKEAQKRFPNLKAIGTTMRVVHSTNRHTWSAVLYIDGKGYQAPTTELDILDRVGGGDGFASGLIYGLLDGREPQEALNLGWAHGAVTTYPGDTTMAKLHQVEALAAEAAPDPEVNHERFGID